MDCHPISHLRDPGWRMERLASREAHDEHLPAAPTAAVPTISVVIPAHNADRFLSGCLASVRAQSSAATEIILVDDASADGTPLNMELRLDDSVTFLRLPDNRGPAAARMVGV